MTDQKNKRFPELKTQEELDRERKETRTTVWTIWLLMILMWILVIKGIMSMIWPCTC